MGDFAGNFYLQVGVRAASPLPLVVFWYSFLRSTINCIQTALGLLLTWGLDF